MRLIGPICIAAAALLLLEVPAAAQTLNLRVRDAETGAGVAGAQVTLRSAGGNTVARAVTDSTGLARVAGEEGPHVVAVEHDGYRPAEPQRIELRRAEELVLELRLSRTVIVLDPLTVVGVQHDPRNDRSRAGMLARRELYAGRTSQMVLMHGDPEFVAAPALSDVLRRLPQPVRAGCRIFFWEGNLVSNTADLAWLQDMSPHHIGAVEYFRTWHDAPQSYRDAPASITSPATCSVIALWSRPDAPRRRGNLGLAMLFSAAVAATALLLAR